MRMRDHDGVDRVNSLPQAETARRCARRRVRPTEPSQLRPRSSRPPASTSIAWPRGVCTTIASACPTSSTVTRRRAVDAARRPQHECRSPTSSAADDERLRAAPPQHRGRRAARRRRPRCTMPGGGVIGIARGRAARRCVWTDAERPREQPRVEVGAGLRERSRTTRARAARRPAPSSRATHGTTARLAATAYGVNCRKIGRAQRPDSELRRERQHDRLARAPGSATRASIQRSSGPAHAKIAPTHENESAKDAVATLCGRANATTIAAIASAFHDKVARPHARAASAAARHRRRAHRRQLRAAPPHERPRRVAIADAARRASAAARAARAPRATERRDHAQVQTGGDQARAPFRSLGTRRATPAASAARSPHSSPATSDARRFAESLAQPRVRPLVRARQPACGASRRRRGARVQSDRAAARRPSRPRSASIVAFARLAGITRVVERFEPPAQRARACPAAARLAAQPREHARAAVERERRPRSSRRRARRDPRAWRRSAPCGARRSRLAALARSSALAAAATRASSEQHAKSRRSASAEDEA